MQKFEDLIQGQLDQGFGVVDDFISPTLTAALRERLLQLHSDGFMYAAGVGKRFDYQKNALVRGDLIHWLDEGYKNTAEEAYFAHLDAFMQYLNRTCYVGLTGYECHFAQYETGSFYRKHRDQFKGDSGRKYSIVLYLNEEWKPEYGGALKLYLPDKEELIYPVGGRCVFFKADEVEHEVQVADRPRNSIAGWFKQM